MTNKFHIWDEKNAPIVAMLLTPVFLVYWGNLKKLPMNVRIFLLLSSMFFSAMLFSAGFAPLAAYLSTGLIVWFWYGSVWGYAAIKEFPYLKPRIVTIYSAIVTFFLTALLCTICVYAGKPLVLPLLGSLGAIYFLLTGVSAYRKLRRE